MQSSLGTAEVPGRATNPLIAQMYEAAGFKGLDDSTPWCAACVGWALFKAGLPHLRALNARAYLDYGTPVQRGDYRPGDIAVFWRGSRAGWQGHVVIIESVDSRGVVSIGGNESDEVRRTFRSWAVFDNACLGVRRPAAPPAIVPPVVIPGPVQKEHVGPIVATVGGAALAWKYAPAVAVVLVLGLGSWLLWKHFTKK
jgi:uncharacterized protein (TIGR02594 family)